MRTWIKRLGYGLLSLLILLNILTASQAFYFTHFYTRDTLSQPVGKASSGWVRTLLGSRYYKSPNRERPAGAYDTLTVRTADGLLLKGWYLPADSMAAGTIILFHGHGGNRSSVIAEASAFHHLGYQVYLFDFRAHGESDGSVCTIGYRESADVKAVYDCIVAKGEKKVVLWGISLGAATILKAVSDYRLQPSALVLEMPFGSLLDAVRGRLRLMGLPVEPLSTLLSFWGGAEQGFWAFGHKPWNYARQVNCPVLLQWGTRDRRVTQAEIQHIYHNLPGPRKTLVEYAFSAHESLYRKEPVKWQEAVSRFLAAIP